jgi:hypothetical protein
MAADISSAQPIYSAEIIRGLAPLIMKWIQQRLINGDKVTLEEAFSYYISFTGKLDSPDAPLPENDDLLQVNARVAAICERDTASGQTRAAAHAGEAAGDHLDRRHQAQAG